MNNKKGNALKTYVVGCGMITEKWLACTILCLFVPVECCSKTSVSLISSNLDMFLLLQLTETDYD